MSTATQIAPILLTDRQAAELLGIGTSKFHEVRYEAWMPQPIALGPKLVRWSRLELEEAVARMPRQSAGEPAQLRRGKIEALKTRGVVPRELR